MDPVGHNRLERRFKGSIPSGGAVRDLSLVEMAMKVGEARPHHRARDIDAGTVRFGLVSRIRPRECDDFSRGDMDIARDNIALLPGRVVGKKSRGHGTVAQHEGVGFWDVTYRHIDLIDQTDTMRQA
jgi:hypothetical protein